MDSNFQYKKCSIFLIFGQCWDPLTTCSSYLMLTYESIDEMLDETKDLCPNSSVIKCISRYVS